LAEAKRLSADKGKSVACGMNYRVNFRKDGFRRIERMA
jgi:hypothetical protein